MTTPCTEQPRMERMEQKIDSNHKELNHKLDKLIEASASNAVLAQAVTDLRDDHNKLEQTVEKNHDKLDKRLGKIEKPVWVGVAFATIGTPIISSIIFWLWRSAMGD